MFAVLRSLVFSFGSLSAEIENKETWRMEISSFAVVVSSDECSVNFSIVNSILVCIFVYFSIFSSIYYFF